nr:tetratricopeptide repeat protein [Longilinea sp.]
SPRHEKEDLNACGPATLAMYLNYWGWQGDQFTISDVIKPIRADRNVNVEELVYYSRNYTGWLLTEYRVGGNLEMLRQLLAAEIPVMIEGSFLIDQSYWPNDDRWAGHYLLVNGYDDSRQSFLLQDSERGPDQMVPYETLKADWQSFNYVYILVYPPEKQETVKAILGDNWDPDQNRQNALELAQAETEADPDNAFAWFNLGTNLVYFDRHADAVTAYDQARSLGLPQRMLRYQFGPFLAYFNALRTEDLLALTDYALDRTANSEEALLWRGWALYRQGNKAEALSSFQQALEAHPGYHDAIYAIEYVQSN